MPSYTLLATSIANANNKNLLAISNATGSGKIIKIYRVMCWNPQTVAVPGGVTGILIGRSAAVYSGGTALTFRPHSSCVTAGVNNPFTGINADSGASAITATIGTEFRRVFRATDEIAAGGYTFDEIQNILPWTVLWDTGYSDSNIEPLVLRENQGFLIRTDSSPANSVGAFSLQVELNIE